mmetsp:Transcript_12442/g.33558  ORF Transcript_12442/g.33558 Transcript_12442/m.33558 type:complete len:649 (-) Transcript_12442:84-2030(-)
MLASSVGLACCSGTHPGGVGVKASEPLASGLCTSNTVMPTDRPLNGGALKRWSALLVEAAHLRLKKRRAVEAEDFAEASRLKRCETDVGARLLEAEKNASVTDCGDEVKNLEDAKLQAVEAEDFEEASRLKKQILALHMGGASSASSLEQLRRQAWAGAIALVSQLGTTPDEARDVSEELHKAARPDATIGAALDVASATYWRLGEQRAATTQRERAESVARSNEDARKRHLEEAVRLVAKRRREKEGAAKNEVDRYCSPPAPTTKSPLRVKEEQLRDTAASQGSMAQVKEERSEAELSECIVAGVGGVGELIGMSNQDLWQHAWKVTWQRADAAGSADDQDRVYSDAQETWKQWLRERDRHGKARAEVDGHQQAQAIFQSTKVSPAPPRPGSKASQKDAGASVDGGAAEIPPAGLSAEQFAAQKAHWRNDAAARKEWEQLMASVERLRTAKDGAPKGGRDLCVIVKQRCPADQPLQFERLLAVCPKGTSVQQLIQAMAKEPQEFRQSWDGGEFCVRPCNSKCVDWLPVQATKTPTGFRRDATLPEEMLTAAKRIFGERIRPQGQVAEDPLLQFLLAPGRLPADTPMAFYDILQRCPPGTTPVDLIRTMSRRRDSFRQDAKGSQFCVKPRATCRDWGAVNPYLDPTKL